jgi:hypothetical protein
VKEKHANFSEFQGSGYLLIKRGGKRREGGRKREREGRVGGY